jgi:hypothetical protein
MKEVISMAEVPFHFPMKSRLGEATVQVMKSEFFDYYYFTKDNYHCVYTYKDGKAELLNEISLHDLIEALNIPEFRNRVKSYIEVC